MPQNQARANPNQPFGQPSERRILFVSGKGGVGKSLLAAAIALEQSRMGRRVLLAEIGDSSYFKDFWSLPEVGHQPVRVPLGFDLALWSGETALREYVLYYLKLERLYKLFFENKVMRSLINVAPGLSEIAILGKITSGIRKVGPPLAYDLIVVDCYSTGHALSLLHAPKGMMAAIQFGPMGHHSRDIEAVLRNSALCGFITVTLLEEMPVVESIEFCRALKALLGIEPELIANKVLVDFLSQDELQLLKQTAPHGLADFVSYIDAIDGRQRGFLRDLAAAGFGVRNVPLVFSNDPETLVRAAGEALRKT